MLVIIWFLVLLSVLVLAHELGHFLAAKAVGVKVEEFGLGYPPRVKTLFTKWGTLFSLNALPLGGFVKLYGDDAENLVEMANQPVQAEEKGRFADQPVLDRLIIILAGVFVNLVLGVMSFALLFMVVGIPSGVQIAQVQPDSPAAQSGLREGDMIVAVKDGRQEIIIRDDNHFVFVVKQRAGKTLDVTVERAGERVTVPVYARKPTEKPADQGSVGVGLGMVDLRFYPKWEMPFRGAWVGFQDSMLFAKTILVALREMVTDMVFRAKVPAEVAGPVGIIDQAGQAQILQQGWLATVRFFGALSINLAVINLLPIPALDGGRAVFVILEPILGRKRRARWEQQANTYGFTFLLILIGLVTVKDIWGIFR